MRANRFGTLLFAAALSSAAFIGCGSSDTGGSGGGDTNTTTTSTSSTTTPTTTTPTTTSSGGPSFLGYTCAKDGDCGADGKCIQVSDNDPIFGGGAPGGYCTKVCDVDADCGLGNTCYDDQNGNKQCLLGCVFGDPPLMYLDDELDPNKCNGRDDLRCQALSDGSEVCIPVCGSDDQCDGRACDPRFAVCVDMPNTGKALGEICDSEAMTTDCAGICIGITGGAAMCTSPCAMGGSATDTFDCGGPDKGVCIYSPMGTGVGDVGFCAQSCTAQDQCQLPNFACFNINLPNNGVCLTTPSCTKDADCSKEPNGVCVDTNIGKRCMSVDYPLGSLEPGMGGGGAGGTGGAGGAGGSTATGGAGGSTATAGTGGM